MTVRMENSNNGTSRFFYSYDRGHSWRGPFALPLFGQPGVMGRTDYLINGPADCLLILTASKANGREGRPFCADDRRWPDLAVRRVHRARAVGLCDHALNGPRLSKRAGDDHPAARCPAELDRRLRLARRRSVVGLPVHSRAGYRRGQSAEPRPPARWPALPDLRRPRPSVWHPRAAQRRSGPTWGPAIVLRDDGGSTDVGYVRSVVRPDGKVVAVYYYTDRTSPTRHIAATIFDPGKL